MSTDGNGCDPDGVIGLEVHGWLDMTGAGPGLGVGGSGMAERSGSEAAPSALWRLR